jgi:hypothetical protein
MTCPRIKKYCRIESILIPSPIRLSVWVMAVCKTPVVVRSEVDSYSMNAETHINRQMLPASIRKYLMNPFTNGKWYWTAITAAARCKERYKPAGKNSLLGASAFSIGTSRNFIPAFLP